MIKVNCANIFGLDKSHIGDPVTKNGVVVGHITDITDKYIFSELDMKPDDLGYSITSFEVVKEEK